MGGPHSITVSASTPHPAEQRTEYMSPSSKRTLSILIVDDDPGTLAQLSASKAMQPEGWLVRTAKEPSEALSMMKQARTDIVVTTLNLGEMSGPELLAYAKRETPNSLRFLYHKSSDKDQLIAELR